jgi:outer membrane protein, heavy metal efflux system
MRPALICRIIIALGCVMISESYSAGYAAELSPGGYTLNQVVQLALQHNPVMSGAEAVLEQSQGQRVTAGAYLNPTITGSAGRGAIREPSTGVSITERTITVEHRWSGWANAQLDNAPLMQDWPARSPAWKKQK